MDDEQTVDEAAEQAALEQAFGDTDVEPGTEEQQGQPEVIPETELAIEVPPVEEIAPEPVSDPYADLRAMIEETTEKSKAQISKLGGKLGELQQRIDAARTSAHGISPKARERLSSDFPELAAMLFDDEPVTIPAPVAVQPVASPVAPIEDIEDAKELLAFDHPDWETVVVSPEFTSWTDTLPPKIAKRLVETYDPTFVSGKLTTFKQFQAAQLAKVEAAKVVEKTADTTKQERLNAAITPRGVPRVSTSSHDEDEELTSMLAAYGKK